jgi:hypothetical protein
VALRVYQNNKKFYDPILKRRDLAKALGAVKASVLLISGAPLSSNALLRAYRQDVDRKKVLIRKSNGTKARLTLGDVGRRNSGVTNACLLYPQKRISLVL